VLLEASPPAGTAGAFRLLLPPEPGGHLAALAQDPADVNEATGAIIAEVPFHPGREFLDAVEPERYHIHAAEGLEAVV
jgi:hypothetical protein